MRLRNVRKQTTKTDDKIGMWKGISGIALPCRTTLINYKVSRMPKMAFLKREENDRKNFAEIDKYSKKNVDNVALKMTLNCTNPTFAFAI